MKIKEVHYYCDVCDKEYANSEIKYKVKSRYGFGRRWHKFSVCEDCYNKFVRMGEKAKEGQRMQIVINIPEDFYKRVMAENGMGYTDAEVVVNAFYLGTPLPKRHGRLIDADAFAKRYEHDRGRLIYGDNFIFDLENNAPTIIEADKAESEDKE